MGVGGEILVVPFFGQGHLLPCIELCKRLSSRNFQLTLIISSFVSSSIRATLLNSHPLVRIVEIAGSMEPPPPPPEASGLDPFDRHHDEMSKEIESLLSRRPDGSPRPVCAVIDSMLSWSNELYAKFGIPTVAFITSGACCTAMEYSTWKAGVGELKPGETRNLPGLPDDVAVSYSDLQRPPARVGPGGPGSGPPVGSEPHWVQKVEGTIALMMNTCHELEGPFLDYLGQQMGKPVWGVGPLLPDRYWNPAGSILRDRDIRPNKQSSHSEEDVIQWLDTKPEGSVVYISFGSEVGPTDEEYAELASALEDSNKSFIWVIRPGPAGGEPGYYPHGLIIRGWAPQLLILSHPSTGGFLTHCGWNSTVEAIGRGVPMLAWPIRGDQFFNLKLVVSHLKIGHNIKEAGMSEMVVKDDIVKGIDRLMGDQETKALAALFAKKFECGFPATSEASLDAFKNFICAKTAAL